MKARRILRLIRQRLDQQIFQIASFDVDWALVCVSPMFEFTPRQMKILEELVAAGFRPVAIPPYESALCLRRGDCAVVLSQEPAGGLRMLAPPSYIIDGNLSVKLRRGAKDVFVWKKTELDVTPERSNELASFREELERILQNASAQ